MANKSGQITTSAPKKPTKADPPNQIKVGSTKGGGKAPALPGVKPGPTPKKGVPVAIPKTNTGKKPALPGVTPGPKVTKQVPVKVPSTKGGKQPALPGVTPLKKGKK